MARQPRFTLPGISQHVIQRGNNREPCFYTEDDYRRYHSDLAEAAKLNNAMIHTYANSTLKCNSWVDAKEYLIGCLKSQAFSGAVV